MRTATKIQQPSPPSPKQQQSASKVTYIKRTSTQVFAAQENISSYYRPAAQSLNKMPENPSKKPLSRRNSQVGPKLSYPGRYASKADLIDIKEESKKKYVGRTPEEIAMHLSASIFMMATTKFVPGYDDLSSLSSQAKSSRQKPISPLKPREGQSTPHNRPSLIETQKTTNPAKDEPKKSVEPKKAASTVKEAGSNRYTSNISGLIENSPRFNQNISNYSQKSKLQQSFDEIASQNASRVSRPQVRIREIQPSEIVHVPSGIRTKVNQPSQSSVKSSISKNPESSIHRIAGQAYVNAARYGNGPNTPRNYNSGHSPQNEAVKDRSVSQPAQKIKAINFQVESISPKRDLKEEKEEPSIIRMGGLTPTKAKWETTPMKYNNGNTPIKSTIGLESRTDLPRPSNPNVQKNQINQYNGLRRPQIVQVQPSIRQIQPTQNQQVNSFAQQNQKEIIRNRFQAEVLSQQSVPSKAPTKSPQRPSPDNKQKAKTVTRIQRVNQQTSSPSKRYPYNDTIIRPKGSQEKIVEIETPQSSQLSKRPARSIEHAAYHMTTQTFLNSTTKYVKQASPPSQSTNKYSTNLPISQESKVNLTAESASKGNRYQSTYKPTDPSGPQQKISPQKLLNNVGTRNQNNCMPISQTTQQKVSSIKQQPPETNPSLSKRPQIQASLQLVAKEISNTAGKVLITEDYKSQSNRLQSSSERKELISSERGKNHSISLEKTEDNNRRSIQKSQRKQEEPTSDRQLSNNQSSKNHKDGIKGMVRIDGPNGQQKEEQKAAPFARQPAVGRSPLLFAKTLEQTPIEKQAQVPATKYPASQTQITKRPIEPSKKAQVQEKSIKIATEVSNSSIISPRASQAQPRKNIVSQKNIQQREENQPNKKEIQNINSRNRYGTKPVQANRNDDSSYQSAKNTTNTLAGSKSSEAFQKVWSPTPAARGIRNKTQLSNSGDVEECIKKEVEAGSNQGKLTLGKRIIMNSDDSNKVQQQKISRQNISKKVDPPSDKSIPNNEINGKKSPANKNIIENTSSARNATNTANNTKITTNSPQNSTIQSNFKAPINNNQVARYGKQPNSTHQASSSQPASAKIIKNITSPEKEITQAKSESHTKAVVPANGKLSEGQKYERQPSGLPKCFAVLWSISKLTAKVVKSSFKALIKNQARKIAHVKQAAILAFTANSFLSTLTKNIYSTSFELIKKNYIALERAQKNSTVNLAQTKNRAVAIVYSLLFAKIRSHYQGLRSYIWFNKEKARTEQQPQRNLTLKKDSLREQLQKRLLTSIFIISKAFYKSHLKQSFDKILISARKTAKKEVRETTKIANTKNQISQARSPPKIRVRDYEGEKKSLLDSKEAIQSEIQGLQFSRVDKKKLFDRQKGKLIKKLQQLRKKNDSVQVEVNGKRKKNQQFKKLIANHPHEAEDELFPVGEPLLNLLTEIYLQVFRGTNEAIDKKQFVKKHSLNSQDCNVVVQEWNALAESLKLKAQIAGWEGVGQKQSKARRQLLQEREKEANLMRNYIRERYLWEWLHTVSVKL